MGRDVGNYDDITEYNAVYRIQADFTAMKAIDVSYQKCQRKHLRKISINSFQKELIGTITLA